MSPPEPFYADGSVTIYHADCLDVLTQLDSASIGACITDPPYNIGVRYGDGTNDRNLDYWTWLQVRVDECRRVSPVVALTHRVSALGRLSGWDWIGAWNKPFSTGARLGNSCLLPHWEPIFLYGIHSLGTQSTFTPDVFSANPEKVPGTKNMRGREGWSKLDAVGHPTPKPLTLMRQLVAAFGQHADTIIDPFMGTGTTLRAAKDLGKRSIGIEIEEAYCELAVAKLGQEVLDFGGAA